MIEEYQLCLVGSHCGGDLFELAGTNKMAG